MRSTLRFLAATAGLVLAATALAQAPTVTVTAPWARATAGGQSVGAAYLTLESDGGDTLTGATSPVADKVEVHEMSLAGGVMTMRPVPALTLPPGKPVTLAPGGYHIMLQHLKQPLVQGQTVSLTLAFAKAGAVTVTVPIQGVAAAGPSAMPAMPGMPGMAMPAP